MTSKEKCPFCGVNEIYELSRNKHEETGYVFSRIMSCKNEHEWLVWADGRVSCEKAFIPSKCPFCDSTKIMQTRCECCNYCCEREHAWELYENGEIIKAPSTPQFNECPTCQEQSIHINFRFVTRDSACKNGHVWHYHNKEKLLGASYPECSQNSKNPCISKEVGDLNKTSQLFA
jgi:hypothetical protein